MNRNPTAWVAVFPVVYMLELVERMLEVAVRGCLGSVCGKGKVLALRKDFQLVHAGLAAIGLQDREPNELRPVRLEGLDVEFGAYGRPFSSSGGIGFIGNEPFQLLGEGFYFLC